MKKARLETDPETGHVWRGNRLVHMVCYVCRKVIPPDVIGVSLDEQTGRTTHLQCLGKRPKRRRS